MRISFLSLYSPNLAAQEEFYTRILGLPLVNRTQGSFSVKAGSTILQFEEKPGATPYHIAFTIPAGREKEVRDELKDRVSIIRHEGNDIIEFPAWKARSFYFYDKDLNIVEFIARKELGYGPDGEKGLLPLVAVGEIGVAVDDIKTIHTDLQGFLDVPVYDGDYDTFCAAGDANGLFILINKNRKDWFPTNDKASTSDFLIEAGGVSLCFEKGRFKEAEKETIL